MAQHKRSGFTVSDLGEGVVNNSIFHYDVSNKMKKDAKTAIDLLVDKEKQTCIFRTYLTPSSLVTGQKKKYHGLDKDLCLRIDLQRDLYTKDVNGRNMKIASVQIQLNESKRPSTIAQVNCESDVEIPKGVIEEAFQRSWEEKKRFYVYKD